MQRFFGVTLPSGSGRCLTRWRAAANVTVNEEWRVRMERPDLDGFRLARPDASDVWLVFDGRRHRIASPSVYISLFGGDSTGIVFHEAFELVDPGPELNDGTCLIRGSHATGIYLVTGPQGRVRRMLIDNYESFLDFGFDMTKVVDIPSLIVDTLPQAKALVSAGSRTKVHAFSASAAIPQLGLLG